MRIPRACVAGVCALAAGLVAVAGCGSTGSTAVPPGLSGGEATQSAGGQYNAEQAAAATVLKPAAGSFLAGKGTVTLLGGQETARTIHFFVASFVIFFFFVHIAMICLAGFSTRVGAMITGHRTAKVERP